MFTTQINPFPSPRAGTRSVPTAKPQASSLKPQASRSGFTLVELLVVITIIGILAGLISVAAVNAVYTAKQMRIKVEVDQLDAAMKEFKQKYGAYPPCDLRVSNDTTSNPGLRAFLARAFPRYAKTHTNQLDDDLTTAGIDPTKFDPARALVFWLNGLSPDVTNPFAITGTRTPIYGFDKTRLVVAESSSVATPTTLPGNHWYLPQGGQNAPFVFFDYRTYSTAASGSNQPSAAAQFSHSTFGGVAQPYALDVNNNKTLEVGTPGADTWANAESIQVISAGQDGNFGTGTGPKLYPPGRNYTSEDNDNNSNFCEKTSLEDAKP